MMWTFVFEGGPALQLQAGSNPPVEHDGSKTVAHMFLSESEVNSLKGVALSRGVALEAWPMQGQSSRQEELRRKRAHQLDLAAFPCVECLECAWSEPFQEDKCGFRTLPEESVQTLLDTSEKHRRDRLDCPVK